MGLTRTSSGLLVHDAFGSDTSANYDTYLDTLSVSGGVGAMATANDKAVHTSSSGAKCISIRARRSGTRWGGAGYFANGSLAAAADLNGYYIYGFVTRYYLQRATNASNTELASSSSDLPSDGAWCHLRVYIHASGITGRFGTAGLGGSLTSTDTTYTAAAYGGPIVGNQTDLTFDDLDIRTAHTITCTGMTTGHYLRVSDGTTAAEAQESSGTATVDAGAVLFPLSSVQIRTASGGGGDLIAEITSATLTDMGGGDAFAYSGATGKPYYYFAQL